MLAAAGLWLLDKIGGKALLYAGVLFAGVALLVGAYQTGANAERKRGEAASLRAQIKILEADRDIAKRSEADALARGAALDSAVAANKDTIDALSRELATRPPGDRCKLSRRDVEWLRRIR